MTESQSSFKVYVRVRPLVEKEKNTDSCVKCVANQKLDDNVVLKDMKNELKDSKIVYSFDKAFDVYHDQQIVYDVIGKSIIENIHKGYNTCLFAYGQTGSGKSHSMMGSDADPGIIPRLCQELLNYSPSNTESFKIEFSYLELYKDNVRDLLSKYRNSIESKTNSSNLNVRLHPEYGVYVEGLTTIAVDNYEVIKKLIQQGNKERATASTLMNNRSSRSHAILTLNFNKQIKTFKPNSNEIISIKEISSKINLVDLAGSEKIIDSGVKGENVMEAIEINKALSILRKVLTKLSGEEEPVKTKPHNKIVTKIIPKGGSNRSTPNSSPTVKIKSKKQEINHIFRESKLTWILKDSLCGNSKTYMLANISPSALYYNETKNTLNYASMAKKITTFAKTNEGNNVKLLKMLEDEIASLKEKIKNATGDERKTLVEDVSFREELTKNLNKSWEEKLEESKLVYEEVNRQLRQQLENAKNEIELVKNEAENAKLEAERKKNEIEHKTNLLKEKEKIAAEAFFEIEKLKLDLVNLEQNADAKYTKNIADTSTKIMLGLAEEYEIKLDNKEKIIQEKVKKEYEDKYQELRSYKKYLKETNEQLKEENNTLKNENNHLKTEISFIKDEKNKLTNEISALKEGYDLAKNQVAKLSDEISKLQNVTLELQNSKLKLESISLELQNTKIKLEDLEKESESKDKELNKLMSVLEDTGSSVRLEEEISMLKEKIKDITLTKDKQIAQERSTHSKQIAQLQSEISRIRNQNK